MRPTKIIRGHRVQLSKDGAHVDTSDPAWQQVLHELNRENVERLRAQIARPRLQNAA